VEGAVPVPNLFLNSAQWTFRLLGSHNRSCLREDAAEGSSFVVAGSGRRTGSIGVADGGVLSLVLVPRSVWELEADVVRDLLNAKYMNVRCRRSFGRTGQRTGVLRFGGKQGGKVEDDEERNKASRRVG